MTTLSGHRLDLLEVALAYTAQGWPVIPLRPGTKRPAFPNHTAATCDGSDRRCADGHIGWEQRATTDPARIEAAWRHRPYGIGIACGPAGLVVVDLDRSKNGKPSGADTLARLEHEHGHQLPPTWTVATPSGGRHLYYLHPEQGPKLGNTTGRLGPGIDTRGHGGQVVAPPTVTTGTDGGEYWLVDDHDPAPLPPWFSELLTPTRPAPITQPDRRQLPAIADTDRARRYVATAIATELAKVAANCARGESNHVLFCASIALGQLVGGGHLEHHHAAELLTSAAHGQTTRADKPNTPIEIRHTIASGLARGLNEPRRLPAHLTTTGASR